LGLTLACAIASDKWIWQLSLAGWSVGGVTAWVAPFPRLWSISLWLVAGWIAFSATMLAGALKWEWNRLLLAGVTAFAAGAVEWWNVSMLVTFCTTGPDAMSPAAKWQMAFAALLAFAGLAQARAWPERIVRALRGG
jgi:hypothetical protein